MSRTYLRCCEKTVEGIFINCPECGSDLMKEIRAKYQGESCSWNADGMKGMSRSLQKFMKENPLCKNAPEYEGYCIEHLPHKLRLRYEWEQTTPEQRQHYLDLLNSGKTIREAYEAAGITFNAALEVTNRAIENVHFLKRVAE